MAARGRHLASPLGRRISRHWALPLALVLSLLMAGVAWADNVQNDVVVGGTDTITVGGTTTITYRLVANASGGDITGCNVDSVNPATLVVSVPAAVTISSTTVLFTACGNAGARAVTFSSGTSGTYAITHSISGGKPGAIYNNQANWTLHVLPLPDITPPVITPNVVGTLGNDGWYTSDVAVSWTVTDAESTITSTTGCGPTTVTTDTTGTTFTCSATSTGGTASAAVTVKRDATAPTIDGSASPAPNVAGWSNSDVMVSFVCSDGTSGVASCGPGQTLTSDGAGQVVTGIAVDLAGNSASATVSNIDIDKTAPSVDASVAPAPNGAGWNDGAVTVSFSGADSLSGIASCDADVPVTTEGTQVVTGSCTDAAGNSGSASVTVKIDTTNPSISATRTPANSHGWNNTSVFVDFSCSDTPSGIASCGPDATLSSEGAAQSATGTAEDVAGRTASLTVSDINIDLTAPSISGARSPLANGFGWNNSYVTVTFTCSDGLSGIDTCTAPVTLSGEGAGQSAAGSAADKAGNTASTTVSGINIDKTAPTISGAAAPAANADGWNNTDVTVSFTCTDGLSGIATCTDPITLSGEGAGQSASGSAADKAGNTASATVSGINIDTTKPVVSNVSPTVLAVNTSASVTFTTSSDLSGIATKEYRVDSGAWTSAGTALLLTSADVVNLCVRATDKAGNVSDPECVLLAVYDPSAGFVTGGGWIVSQAGAYAADPTLTGKATFGFVSKYRKGATVPEGNTEFQFHAAGLNFKSTSYEWLVVSGSRAQYKGVGTLNGTAGYGFMLTAIDGSPDRFRIKIWSISSGTVVYDNQMGGADTADPTTAIAGGSIVIHTTKK